MVVDYAKLKTNLNLIMHRLKLVEKKKIEQNSKARRLIAELITSNKVDRARIKVEQIVMQDYLVEAMDMIEQFCDLILSRFGQLKSSDTIDEGLQAAISSLIWVTPRLESEVPELRVISDQLGQKYGKQYVTATRENQLKTVSESLMKKMGVQAPSRVLIENYLVEIAKDQKVDYKPDQRVLKEHEASMSSNLDISSDDDDTHGAGGQRRPETGFNLIDLGDHYPINPITQPFNPYGAPPPVPGEPPAPLAPSKPPVSNSSGGSSAPRAVPIGFNLDDITSSSSSSSGGSAATKRVVKKVQATNEGETSSYNEAVPPHYDSVVDKPGDSSHYYSFADHQRSRDDLNNSLPELPPVPKDLTDNPASTTGDDTLDFDLLTRRFEELKSKKP